MNFHELKVMVTGDSSRFTAAMKKNQSSLARFSQSAKSIASVIAGMFAAKAVFSFASGVLETTDSLQKLSRRLNLTLAQVDALDLAFQKGGMDASQAAKPLDYFNRRLGELRSGLGSTAIMFERLDLNAEALEGKSYFEVLTIVGKKIKGLSKDAAALASAELFGRGVGVKVAEGFAGLDDAAQRIREINSALGVTNPKNIEQLNDTVTDLKKQTQMTARVVLAETSPALQALVEGAGKVAMYFVRVARGMEQIGIEAHTRNWGTFKTLLTSIFGLPSVAFLAGVKDGIAGINNEIKGTGEAVAEAGFAESLSKSLEKWVKAREDLTASLAKEIGPSPFQKFMKEGGRFTDAFNAGMIDEDQYTRAMKGVWDEFERTDEKMQRAKELSEKYKDELAELRQEMADLKSLQADGIIDSGVVDRGVAELQNKIDDIQWGGLKHQFEEISNAAAGIFEETRTPFEKFQEELQKINYLFEQGAIDAETYMRKYNSELKAITPESAPKQQSREAGAVSGSGFMSVIARSRVGGQQNEQQKMLNEQQRIRSLLEVIAQNTQQQGYAYV